MPPLLPIRQHLARHDANVHAMAGLSIVDGYIPMPSNTYRSYAVLRSNLASGSENDVAKAVAYGKRVKLYPLAQAANPPQTVFIDAADSVYDTTIPYDLHFFQSLDRSVQSEPWLERDKAMIDQLKSIGIEKSKPFNPDVKTQEILNTAAHEARTWLDAKYETAFRRPISKERIGQCRPRPRSSRGLGQTSQSRTATPSMAAA